MSDSALKSFLAKIKGNESLQRQLLATGSDPIAIAKSNGFDIDQATVGRWLVRSIVAVKLFAKTHPNVDKKLLSDLSKIFDGDFGI